MQTGFYLAVAVMLVVGFLMTALPLIRRQRWLPAALVAVALVGGSLWLYPIASNFVPRSAAFEAVANATTEAEARAAADALRDELMASPERFEAWRLLGRARLELNEFKDAEFAFRQALRLSPFQDPELLVMLGESLTYAGGSEIPEEAIDLFLAARDMAPNNPKALWYAGLGLAARGDNLGAAEAWEGLLATSPPPDVVSILSERIAVLRATAEPAIAPADATDSDAGIRLDVSLAANLAADWPDGARLFVSVRDPARPGPPLAAVQYPPQSLPLRITLADSDAMIAGRNISSASSYEIVARISLNGDPAGAGGDPVGRISLDAGQLEDPVALVIDALDQR